MLPEIDYPDYLPEDARVWARDHRELLELVVEELLRTGTWQPLTDLTRKLAREGRPASLRSIFWEMPKPLGFINHNPERVILTPFGLRTTYAGHKLLAGFTGVLTIAAERYVSEDDEPTITRADAARGTVESDPYVTALSDIALAAPFLGSGHGGPDEEWTREITDDVVRYLHARSTETYLRTRAAELAGSPQLGWQPTGTLEPSQPAIQAIPYQPGPSHQPSLAVIVPSNEPEHRDVFISHASEDKDAIARPLAEELRRRGHSVWFDEYELVIGDSLRRKIDAGLAGSTTGVVILSHAFFSKPWPQLELDGFTARLTGGESNVIVPIWHGLTESDMLRYSPTLAGLLAARSDQGVSRIADEIERVLARRAQSAVGPGPTVGGSSTAEPPSPPKSATANAPIPSSGAGGEAIVGLLTQGNEVALRETLRRGRKQFEEQAERLTHERSTREADLAASLPDIARNMAQIVDQTVPLIRHRSPLVEEQARWLAQLAPKRFVNWGVAAWVELPQWMAWGISQACGACALSIDELPAVHAMLAASVDHGIPGLSPEPLASIGPGHAAQVAGQLIGGKWEAPWIEQWTGVLRGYDPLKVTIPEFYEGDDEAPRGWLLAYSLLATVFSGQHGQQAAAPWTAYISGGHAFTERLHRDDAFLGRVADSVFGCSADEFRLSAAGWLSEGLSGGRTTLFSPVRSLASLDF